MWKDNRALDYWECVGDDLDVKDVKTFVELAELASDGTAVFAWAMFESREHRDACDEKIVADCRLSDIYHPNKPPFDNKRMVFEGFLELVHR